MVSDLAYKFLNDLLKASCSIWEETNYMEGRTWVQLKALQT